MRNNLESFTNYYRNPVDKNEVLKVKMKLILNFPWELALGQGIGISLISGTSIRSKIKNLETFFLAEK